MGIKDGAPYALLATERTRWADVIERRFHLAPRRLEARNDFYVITRADGTVLLALRLSRAKFKRTSLFPGELRPELAHILCLAAGLKAKHALLDPFAGYGAIAYEAVRGFGCKDVLAFDKVLLSDRHLDSHLHWQQLEVARLETMAATSIDRIITDPPWGEYGSVSNLGELYDDFAVASARLLKPGAIAVVLTSNADILRAFRLAGLTLVKSWRILVSGKKAVIYKFQRPT